LLIDFFQSGGLAAMINLSQFFVIIGAGPVSATVVGHVKTCLIVALGWFFAGRGVTDRSAMGVVLAIGGIFWYAILRS
jgi:solute carrier family 35, member E3